MRHHKRTVARIPRQTLQRLPSSMSTTTPRNTFSHSLAIPHSCNTNRLAASRPLVLHHSLRPLPAPRQRDTRCPACTCRLCSTSMLIPRRSSPRRCRCHGHLSHGTTSVAVRQRRRRAQPRVLRGYARAMPKSPGLFLGRHPSHARERLHEKQRRQQGERK